MYQTLHQGFFRLERSHLHLFIRKRFWKIINNCLPSLKSTCHQVCFVGLKKTHLRHLFQVLKQQKRASGIWKLKALKRTRKVEAEYHRKHNWMHPALPSWTMRLMGLVPAPFSTPWTWHSMGAWPNVKLQEEQQKLRWYRDITWRKTVAQVFEKSTSQCELNRAMRALLRQQAMRARLHPANPIGRPCHPRVPTSIQMSQKST